MFFDVSFYKKRKHIVTFGTFSESYDNVLRDLFNSNVFKETPFEYDVIRIKEIKKLDLYNYQIAYNHE